MKNKEEILQLINTEYLTDRDEAIGIGEARYSFWESLGEDMIPTPKQTVLLMCPALEIFVVASRGSGKTHFASIRILEEMALPNRSIYIIAPQFKHTKYVFDPVCNAIRRSPYFSKKIQYIRDNSRERAIKLKIGSRGTELICLSADNPDALIGMGSDLIVVDEAAIMSNEAFSRAYPSLNRLNRMGRLVAISSPRGANWFQENYLLALDRENRCFGDIKKIQNLKMRAFKMHILDNPYASHQSYYDALEKAKELDTPYHWAIHNQEWEAEFNTFTGDVFWLSEDIWFPKNFYTPTPNEPIIIGIDYARVHDYCVCTAFTKDKKMVGFERWNQSGDEKNIELIVKFISQFYRPGRIVHVYIDATGEGSSIPREVQTRLRKSRMSGISITGVKFSHTLKNNLIETLKVELANEDIALWDIQDIKRELADYKARETTSGNVVYEAEKGNDDIVASLLLSIGNIKASGISVN